MGSSGSDRDAEVLLPERPRIHTTVRINTKEHVPCCLTGFGEFIGAYDVERTAETGSDERLHTKEPAFRSLV